jgi:hypothetical protein
MRYFMFSRFLSLLQRLNIFLKASSLRKFSKSDVLLVRHDADCGYTFDKLAFSPLIDSIVDLCRKNNFSPLSIASPYSKLTVDDAYNYPLSVNRYFFKIALLGLILKNLAGTKSAFLWKQRQRENFWESILIRVKPKLIIGIHPEPELCEAAAKLGIPSYDLQHGVVAIEHWPYAKTTPVGTMTTMPSGFLCWDQQSALQVRQWAQQFGAQVYVSGNPWFERFRNIDAADRLVRENIAAVACFKSDKINILVSLQWGLHLHYYTEGSFNKVMCKALETAILKTGSRAKWFLRLHPVQIRGDEGKACLEYLNETFGHCDWVEWVQATRLALPIVLSQSDLHITDMSSVVIEAAWFNVPSALLNPLIRKGQRLEGLYSSQIDAGIATLVEQSEEDIVNWINAKSDFRSSSLEQSHTVNRFEDWLLKQL